MVTPTRICAAALLLAAMPASTRAQRAPLAPRSWDEAVASSELEAYLRTLEGSAIAPLGPWSLRAFTADQLHALLADTAAPHPWKGRLAPPVRGTAFRVLRPMLATRWNSGFAYGGNEYGVWSGRGLTASVHAGFIASLGVVRLRVEPLAFRAWNQGFPLYRVEDTTVSPFSDPLFPTRVDLPQRFGNAPYARVEPGQSYLAIESRGVTAGLSTANESWGPSQSYPFLLGANAAGFPHLFLGSSTPARIGIGRLHVRYLVGRLSQSAYFRPRGITRPRRVGTGLAVTFQPRGVRGLEIGAARFFHIPYPDSGLRSRDFTRVFQTGYKSGIPENPAEVAGDSRSLDGENQLASAYLRWAAPHGLEAYIELGREDHPWDSRELIVLPDRQMALAFGMRRTWRPSDRRTSVLRAEQLSYLQTSASRLGYGFSHITYIHGSGANQGHTQRGLLLGAPLGPGSASGLEVAWDGYDPSGRRTLAISRVIQRDLRLPMPDGTRNPGAYDVTWTLSADRLWMAGSTDVRLSLYAARNFNRYFAGDAGNLGARLAVSPGW